MRRVRSRLMTLVLGMVAATLFAAPPAQAQEPDESFELPPLPADLPAELVITVFFPAFAPVFDGHVCPAGETCVLGGGGGIGARIERRWSSGLGIALSYEAWFANSNGIYEIGVMQTLQMLVRYMFLPENVVHPWVGASVGGIIFGDTFRVATVGFVVDLLFGLSWELSHTVSFVAAAGLRLFALDAFEADRVLRAEGFGVDGTLEMQVGVAISL
jgi:hypothetical protein